MRYLTRNQLLTVAGAAVASVGPGFLHGRGAVLPFAISAATLASLASVVGFATEQLGERFGPGATGIVQSAIGNMPELFVGTFALRAGMVAVVQAAVNGSILANSLLILGLALLVGGLTRGPHPTGSSKHWNRRA